MVDTSAWVETGSGGEALAKEVDLPGHGATEARRPQQPQQRKQPQNPPPFLILGEPGAGAGLIAQLLLRSTNRQWNSVPLARCGVLGGEKRTAAQGQGVIGLCRERAELL